MQVTKKIKLIDFKLTKSIGNLLFGLYKSRFCGNGINFFEHREYVFGEPVKNIDWKASSKAQKIYSKIFEEEKELNVLFLIDTNSSMLFGSSQKSKKDLLEEVFYALAFSSYKNSDNFGVFLFDGINDIKLPYKKDFGNIFKTIKILENIENTGKIEKNRLKIQLEKLKKLNIKDNLIFILSDYIFDENDKNLSILSLGNEIIYVNIFDVLENNLNDFGNEISLNSGTKFLEISQNSKKIEKFNLLRKQKIKNFENILKKNNIGYIFLDTEKDVFKELYHYFSKI
ncbi:hypothetical protein BKN14_01920 [Candidatus Gracilibacteria bacterium HOT-871]|nr:hypothetical protein BKN14_01920 [Candidatus Gracilibacteria bacterium HOT-871]MBB1565154.1 DUF58 domain-containing protein [Candidatus Gracilibacteria bacterium]